MFKKGGFEIELESPIERDYGWLLKQDTHHCYMGLNNEKNVVGDLEKLMNASKVLRIHLPQSFVNLLSAPKLWRYFRSMNGGFFDLSTGPIKSPITNGFFVPFITDSQYCHYFCLHLLPNRKAYQIVWFDDFYYGAILATKQEFLEEYADEFDKFDVYEFGDDFEIFMYFHYLKHEMWFKAHGR